MKIIHITPSYKPAFIYGGTISSIAQLCEAQQKAGQTIEVFTTTANGKEELCVETSRPTQVEGVKVTYFRRITKDHTHFSPALLWHIYRVAVKRPLETIIHIHSWWNLTSLLSCLIAKYKNIPVVLSPRGMLTPYSFSNRNGILKSILHCSIGKTLIAYSAIHATSEKERQDILTISKQLNITVIPNLMQPLPPDFELVTEDTAQSPVFKLLFFSRIEEKKGLEILFHALSLLQFPWTLTIAGTGKPRYEERLKKMTETLGIYSKIEWAGRVEDTHKYKVLQENDLLVLFSYNENFANAVGESLTVGTPVAISCHVGLASFVNKHNLGWVSELNPNQISDVLAQAHNERAKRTQIRKIAPAIISQHFRAGLIPQYSSMYHFSL